MKVKQIVGEHKKGFRAKKYARKPKSYIEPIKPQGPVAPGEEVKKQPVKEEEQALGKVSKVNPDGTVDIQRQDGSMQTIRGDQLKPGQGGQLTMPVPKIQPGMSVNAQQTALETNVEEGPEVPYYVQTGPQPMAKTTPKPTAIVPSKMWTAITPEIQAKAEAQGFRKVMLQFNGQQVPGLEGGDQQLGSKIIVAPSDFQAMSTPGASTMRRPMGVQSAEKTGIGAPSVKESDDALLKSMLSIARLR